jgi:toxin HigB-1
MPYKLDSPGPALFGDRSRSRRRSRLRSYDRARARAALPGEPLIKGLGRVVRLTSLVYNRQDWMIRSYRDTKTERFAAGEGIRPWEPFRQQAEKRLRILDAATSPGDLAALNSNRLEALRGDRKGQHSIRINAQWRICFRWPKDEPGPLNVEIVDYH